ncbi:PTS system fructose subfamily IIA component [Coriobacterium glomerans PW2]|uniref:PTS system fructose subfamily IIA component n=1 Tax=Coriobacterium glomerans (strain ATCC 49209 / DSM 20642 / JCM 10262 / PW2) TaxID=700015 RepID=F2N7V1_CORGP|nr:PTS sugar transporter subunit IIA [Coriobacterium glomerans]AEB07060.1 PTS system fructose subfamily IIA component [Coriobacterium glomerans PW2]
MKYILASHGGLSKGMLETVQMILGPQKDMFAFSLHAEDEAARLGEQLTAILSPEDEGNVIFFTDVCFGSPFNQVVEISRAHDIFHITGMNLPSLIEALVCRSSGKTASEIVSAVVSVAQSSIKDVRGLLSQSLDVTEGEEW